MKKTINNKMAETVQALETEAKSLLFTEEKKQKVFELGTCMAVYSWSALETAVDNQWAGAESADIRDWMVAQVVDLFDDSYIDAATIEKRLLDMMLDEYEVEVDDGSAAEVSSMVIEIYRQCADGDFKVVTEMYQKYEQKEEQKKKGLVKPNVVKPQAQEGDDDDDDEEWEDDDSEPTTFDNQPVENQGPIVDEDGFELVQSKKKGGR